MRNAGASPSAPARQANRKTAHDHHREDRRGPTGKRPTTITAKIDVGFGNSLSIRGEGAGLSWEKGEPLLCVDGSTWVWSRPAASEPVTFKLLLNDQVWCGGQNFTAAAGEHAQVIPVF